MPSLPIPRPRTHVSELPTRLKYRLVVFRGALAAAALAFLSSAWAIDPSNLFLGNPSQANAADKNNLLVPKEQFVLSYDNETGEPNWVSWCLLKSDLGEAMRKHKFSEDLTLPKGIDRISDNDYQDSGFDRGHICPHGDRAANKVESYSTFVMTNIVPQSAQLNRNAWNQEEIYLRSLAAAGNRIYIIAGPVGRGGIGSKGPAMSVDKGRVVVPAACWKVALVVPDEGRDDLKEITPAARVIAVVMPNDTSPGYEWGQYRTSVAAIEKKTGLHFFTTLPVSVASALKTKIDSEKLPPPVKPEWQSRTKAEAKKPASGTG